MKRQILLLFILLFVVSACGAGNRLSREGTGEKEFVSRFLNLMTNSYDNDEEMIAFLAPSYITANNITLDKFNVNAYSPTGFSIQAYDPKTGIITTRIWGEDRSWVHEVLFKLVIENDQLYLMPGRHSESFVDPWFEVHSYITE